VTDVPVPIAEPPADDAKPRRPGVPPEGGTTAPAAPMGLSPWRDSLRRLRRNKLAVAGAVFLLLLVLACYVLPAVFPTALDPLAQDPDHYNERPSLAHLFGRDNLGRDYLARVLVGGGTSLLVGLVGTLVCVVIGTFVGSVAGYFGGKVDDVLMRFVDFLWAVPYMFLVILIMLMFEDSDRSWVPVFASLGLVNWLTMARIVRGQVLTLRHQEYVLAARVTGASHTRIIARHLLPNCLGPITVYATLQVASVILLESFLSYLGLGLKLSWGVLVAEGVSIVNPIQSDWWLLLWPSLFLAGTLLSLNFLGDGLRDAFDPRTRR
jgi:oligopeptide transport system permease protein